ncbi:hypothetical protein [Actinacidiphila sp. bgisy167]|uniref:hypothetical protein n=1 Tax=Actinacidiphila sp. bgisy167 TaxID=3413797 RepID=UPI003D70FC28
MKRLTALRVRVRAGLRGTPRGDSGQTSFEYLGIAVVIAVIIGVLAGTTSIGQAVLDGILGKIADIVGAG